VFGLATRDRAPGPGGRARRSGRLGRRQEQVEQALDHALLRHLLDIGFAFVAHHVHRDSRSRIIDSTSPGIPASVNFTPRPAEEAHRRTPEAAGDLRFAPPVGPIRMMLLT
jgi:hypothetical protein